MAHPLFNEIVTIVIDHDPFFHNNIDCTGKEGISGLLKCTSSIRQLAYGVHAEFLDEYMQISERISRTALDHFCQAVMQIYGPEFLRKLTVTDVEKLYLHHEEKHGFPGMLGSLDFVASQDLWIWHAFFGVSGSNNDINVLYQSPLFNDLKTGRALEIPFVDNGVNYRSGYYLVDGIYPELAPLVKTILESADDDHKRILYKQKRESTRKDVERAFGVLKKKWLTLLKSVLGASPLYNMSIFKVPKGVLKVMESIRSNFFKGASMLEKKISWIAWDKVLASKKKGGLGVSSYFALNRALLLKWVWRFVSQDDSLWFRVIQAVHGDKIDSHSVRKVSIWSSILKEVQVLKSSGFDFLSYCSKRIGDGQSTSFWKETWMGDIPLCELCPRLFALDSAPNICVAAKMAGPLDTSFRRSVRGGVEQQEFSDLSSFLNSVVLSTSNDRWYFSLSSSGEFSVKDTRLAIDDLVLPSHSEPTRWVKLIPIKINVFMWRARRGCLPTRYNLVQKGVILESTSCPVCFSDEEDVHHLLFRCSLSQEVLHRVCRWWEIDFQLWRSFSEWDEWFSSIRLPGSVKGFLEGVFYVAWWFIWGFRNRSTFDVNKPSRSILFENIVSSSFLWCNNRCSRKFSRDDWLKNPHLISL
ncbi:RNA-directed DNA polymerase, eukaryota [Tanacetum coccineum]|uniref:RNA-directed DNA polymerase, eukaryota n=1 Tax=Tanacetum coccineum TaxID=301880 RepID=A0ABQ4YPH7_9ASTR